MAGEYQFSLIDVTKQQGTKTILKDVNLSFFYGAHIGVIGGTNVQFAYDPVSDRIIVIEINPRTSRSSALASKATGFPIAKIAALLAVGFTLDEITNNHSHSTPPVNN